MTWRQGTAHFVAGLALLALAGCGTVELFGEYEIPESADVAAAPWPRLVDVPDAPPHGEYTEAVPDPAIGVVAQAELGVAADAAGSRATALAGTGPGLDPAAQPGAAALAAAEARAEALSTPVISPAEREDLLERARQAQQR